MTSLMIKKLFLLRCAAVRAAAVLSLLCLSACAGVEVPEDFQYKEIYTRNFTLASWQKITNPKAPFKIYIEGDGFAFDAYGRPTANPTPRGKMIREVAFGDPAPNVVYLARPCQFVKDDPMCDVRYWTSARFSPAVIDSSCEAVGLIAGNRPVTLVGYSGGAMVAGLLSITCPVINLREVVTVAGNLDHVTWTRMEKLTPLNESMNLADYKEKFANVPQRHYVGARDDVVPYGITMRTVGDRRKVKVVAGASHHDGFQEIYPEIWN